MMHTYQASVKAKVNGRSQVVKTEVRALNAQDARWLLWAQYGFHSIQVGPTFEVQDRVGDLIAFVRDAALILVCESFYRNADQLGSRQKQAQTLSRNPSFVKLVAVSGGAGGVYRRARSRSYPPLGFGRCFSFRRGLSWG
jgi:hypothetical protein